MRSRLLLSMILLSAAALATLHEQEDTQSGGIESDGLGEARSSVIALLTDYYQSCSLLGGHPAADNRIVSIAGESAAIQAINALLPSNLRVQEFTSLYGEMASKASVKKAEFETAFGSRSKYHSNAPSKPTPKPTTSSPSNRETSMALTPTIRSIPTTVGGVHQNDTALTKTSKLAILASNTTSTRSNTDSDSETQNAALAASTPTPSSSTNVGAVEPTGTLKAAGALAIGMAGIMILL